MSDIDFTHVEAAAADWHEAKQVAKEARARLVELVTATRREGASLGDLASVLGISRERVRQMTGDPDDRLDPRATIEVHCEKCDAAPGEECMDCEKARGAWSFHIERSHRRQLVQEGKITELLEGEAEAMLAGLDRKSQTQINAETFAKMSERRWSPPPV